jgi:hypothetical protein
LSICRNKSGFNTYDYTAFGEFLQRGKLTGDQYRNHSLRSMARRHGMKKAEPDKDRKPPVPADQVLELKAEPEDIVRLWLARNEADPHACISMLDKLLHRRAMGRGSAGGYRFLGACRQRKAGVDYLCMSFCLVRDRSRAVSGRGFPVDQR